MATIHFIAGEKGGVGKSLFCKTFAQYFLDHNVTFTLAECDRSNPDVLRAYKGSCPNKVAVFSESPEHEDSANHIYNLALSQQVLVNLPAQCFIPLSKWFLGNELGVIGREDGVNFTFLHISDAGFDSLHLFRKTIETFGDAASYVFVKNLGRADDWSAFDQDTELLALLEQYNVSVLEFPKLIGAADKNKIDQLSLTFAQALEYKKFSSITKQRIRKFLRDAYSAFDALEIIA